MTVPPPTPVLADVARAVAVDGGTAAAAVVGLLTESMPELSLSVRTSVDGRYPLAAVGAAAGGCRVDIPLRSGPLVVGMLTATSDEPVGASAQRVLQAAADILATGLHLDRVRNSYELALVDAEGEHADLAHDLHEGIAQTLVAARHAVAIGAAPTTVGAVLGRATREGRRAVGLLRPRAIDGDLARALRALASDLTAAGTVVTVETDTLPPLSPAYATLAYRVVTAALREETGAIRVQVRLIRAETLVVTVSGMAEAVDTGAVVRWRRRVQAVGGVLDAATDGLRLELSLPREASASANVVTLGVPR